MRNPPATGRVGAAMTFWKDFKPAGAVDEGDGGVGAGVKLCLHFEARR